MKIADLNSDNTIVIACGMLKNEIQHVMSNHNLEYPIVWIEKGLHEYPERLKQELEKEIPNYIDKKYVIFLYGMCGYAVIGLCSENSTLVVPKFDDCVRFLMCREKGELIPTKADRFYFTESWVDSEKFIFNEFDRFIEDYGEEDGRGVAEMMISGYMGINIIENGTYDSAAVCKSLRPRAAEYDLECECVQGTLRIVEKILLGHWDEEIVVKQPGETITMEDFNDRTRCEY